MEDIILGAWSIATLQIWQVSDDNRIFYNACGFGADFVHRTLQNYCR